MTTQTLHHGSESTIRLIDRIWTGAEMAYARLRAFEQRRVTEAALADLTAEQLDDIGIRSSKDARPLITVEAGLMARLMSLR